MRWQKPMPRFRPGWTAFVDAATQRIAYVDYLVRRLQQRQAFVQEAIDARR